MNTVFETDRLLVRLLVREDFAPLYSLCGDAEVMKYVGNLKPYSEPRTRQVILKCLRSYEWHGYGGWALVHKAANEFVGYGGFEFVRKRQIAELFYIFLPAYWGQGLASEFACAAVEYGFRQLDLKRIGTSFDPANLASINVASKAGFAYSSSGFDEFNLPTVYYEIAQEQI